MFATGQVPRVALADGLEEMRNNNQMWEVRVASNEGSCDGEATGPLACKFEKQKKR